VCNIYMTSVETIMKWLKHWKQT